MYHTSMKLLKLYPTDIISDFFFSLVLIVYSDHYLVSDKTNEMKIHIIYLCSFTLLNFWNIYFFVVNGVQIRVSNSLFIIYIFTFAYKTLFTKIKLKTISTTFTIKLHLTIVPTLELIL